MTTLPPGPARWRWLPNSLTGQVLLALAGALLLAQTISAALLYKAQAEYQDEGLSHALALRATMAIRRQNDAPLQRPDEHGPDEHGRNQHGGSGHQPGQGHGGGGSGGDWPERRGPILQGPTDDPMRPPRPDYLPAFAPQAGDETDREIARHLTKMLAEQDITPAELMVVRRPLARDPEWAERLERRYAVMGKHHPPRPVTVLVAAVRVDAKGPWVVVRASLPLPDPWLLISLIAQTLFIYAVLVGAMALILRHIARPLAQLTSRVSEFAQTRDAVDQIVPQGPDDVRRLIEAHNAMEQRITALINEKDVMLGAIGHDLKTPLAALRVRIESVEDDTERTKMAKTIEDITHSLDDILSLARVGRPSDPQEATELSALVASIVEEYEDMGEPVALEDTSRMVLTARATWLRRALRNLIDNALRYGHSAEVSVRREAEGERGWAVVRVEDPGKGIPEDQIEHMFQPFTRGEPSRNTATGGAGLGLTLARAIAEQHGGRLDLANRHGAQGEVVGLVASLRLPLRA